MPLSCCELSRRSRAPERDDAIQPSVGRALADVMTGQAFATCRIDELPRQVEVSAMRRHVHDDKTPAIATGPERADMCVHFPQPADMHRGVVERCFVVPDRLQAVQSQFRIGFVPRAAIAASKAIDVGRTGDRGVGTKFDAHRIGNSSVQRNSLHNRHAFC
jgi:hypothetical protein